MHAEAIAFVYEQSRRFPIGHVLEIGGLAVNGNIRHLVPHKSWHCVDIVPGPSVDEVADAADYIPTKNYDLVVCLEVFEHTWRWREIIPVMYKAVSDQDGNVLISAACEPRAPHGAYGATDPEPHEWYQNVSPNELKDELDLYFSKVSIEVLPRGDVRAVGQLR